jgi:septum site-determining protein MinD
MTETTHFSGSPTKKRSPNSFSNLNLFPLLSKIWRKSQFRTFSNVGIASTNFEISLNFELAKKTGMGKFNTLRSQIVTHAQSGNGYDEVKNLREITGSATNFGGKESSLDTQKPVETPIVGVDKNSETERVIVVTSGKGGVGKTTTTANLGMSIARLGYRVALIDADIGLRNLDLLLGLENRVLYTAMDIVEGQCRLDQALIRDKRWKNLALLAISKNRQKYNVTRKNMQNLIDSVKQLGFHFILIDCPAGIDVGFINAIAPAQEAVIVTTPEITAIRDADRVAGLLEANGIYNVKLIVNRVRPDMIQKNDMMSVRDVQEMLGIPLLGAIPEDTNVIISTNRGEPLVLNKKLTLSGIAFENAARRLIGKQDYFIDVTSPQKGMFQKLQEFFLGED